MLRFDCPTIFVLETAKGFFRFCEGRRLPVLRTVLTKGEEARI